MEIKTFFDPEKAIKAHEGTILAFGKAKFRRRRKRRKPAAEAQSA